MQVSNAITVDNTNVPSPISVSSGAEYSINGGPFTSVAGESYRRVRRSRCR
jgi:hypothetical protein